jgi:sugar/nucleoside kinase (ribokinase family)
MPDRRVVVVGDVIDDVVAVPLGPVRTDTDTPSSIRFTAGGSAANTATWLGVLGASVDFVGLVGHGDSERHAARLAAAGVTPFIATHPTLPTGTIVVIVNGEHRTMYTERGANAALDPESVTDELLASARVLHLTGYSLFGAADAEPFARLIRRARAAGVQVSIDPGSAGFIADYGIDRFLDDIAGADLVFPNLEEGRVLTGLDEPHAIVAALRERFEVVALTLDAGGVIVAAPGVVPILVEAVVTKIVDPTGAGDAFSAGFIAEWTESGDPILAATAGTRVAARAIASIGARPPVQA